MGDYTNAIEIKELCKNFDGFCLDHVTFNLPKGCIMGLVGQNGAGKTTIIKSLLGIHHIDGGEIKMLGMDSVKQEKAIKENISAVFDEIPFHNNLSADELNKILKRIYKQWNSDVFYGYIDRFKLPRKRKISNLSKGMKMKLQIAAALSHEAELLIMDEATGGLDPIVRSEMLDVFQEYIQNDQHSILMSSHITSDLERIADMITYIHDGKVLLSDEKDRILENHGIIKCGKNDVQKIDRQDIVFVRQSEFGADVMVKNKQECKHKYPNFVMDNAALDEVLLFYVYHMNSLKSARGDS